MSTNTITEKEAIELALAGAKEFANDPKNYGIKQKIVNAFEDVTGETLRNGEITRILQSDLPQGRRPGLGRGLLFIAICDALRKGAKTPAGIRLHVKRQLAKYGQ